MSLFISTYDGTPYLCYYGRDDEPTIDGLRSEALESLDRLQQAHGDRPMTPLTVSSSPELRRMAQECGHRLGILGKALRLSANIPYTGLKYDTGR